MLDEYNIRGTVEVYTIAIRSCSLNGDLQFALEIYNDMKSKGIQPDEVSLLLVMYKFIL
jgi:pentatricopeptide repeat protein